MVTGYGYHFELGGIKAIMAAPSETQNFLSSENVVPAGIYALFMDQFKLKTLFV